MEHWYTLHTKPWQEHQAHDYLCGRQVEVYMPTLQPAGKRGRRDREQPLFARYLFVRGDLDRQPFASVQWTPGAIGLVRFDGRPAVVPDPVIDWLKKRVGELQGLDYHKGLPLRPGDRLRVTAGPLQGAEAIFDRRLSAEDRARVLIDLLGRLVSCEVPMEWLETIS